MNHPPGHRVGPWGKSVWAELAVDDRETFLLDLSARVVFLPRRGLGPIPFAIATWRHHATLHDARLTVADDQQSLHGDSILLELSQCRLPDTLPGSVPFIDQAHGGIGAAIAQQDITGARQLPSAALADRVIQDGDIIRLTGGTQTPFDT